jgi:hypothetical protein
MAKSKLIKLSNSNSLAYLYYVREQGCDNSQCVAHHKALLGGGLIRKFYSMKKGAKLSEQKANEIN